MLAYLAYQVYKDVFARCRAHFNDKGHTHTDLDQTFRTLIRKFSGTAINTIGELLECMRTFLATYNCVEARELHAIFNIAGALPTLPPIQHHPQHTHGHAHAHARMQANAHAPTHPPTRMHTRMHTHAHAHARARTHTHTHGLSLSTPKPLPHPHAPPNNHPPQSPSMTCFMPTAWLAPFTRDFGGFATTKLSEGMHEIEFYKDSEGVVRALFRRHCLSSTWFPEGAGYPVFTKTPKGAPTLCDLKSDDSWSRTKAPPPTHTPPPP